MGLAHEVKSQSLISVRCSCGYSWRNDLLKGKSDLQLEEERDEEYVKHLRAMEAQGF